MKFLVHHDVDGTHSQEGIFNTRDNDFASDFGAFCNRTGRTVKDVLTFKIAQKTALTGKNFNEIAVSVEIHLCISFGNLHDVENFCGTCNTKVDYTLAPADPGEYAVRFSNLDRTIANLIIARYQNSALLDI